MNATNAAWVSRRRRERQWICRNLAGGCEARGEICPGGLGHARSVFVFLVGWSQYPLGTLHKLLRSPLAITYSSPAWSKEGADPSAAKRASHAVARANSASGGRGVA